MKRPSCSMALSLGASLLASFLFAACGADQAPHEADDDGDGACDCAPANGIGSCESGACVVACLDGFANCDGDPDNGCEVTLASDASHCGQCGLACTFDNAAGVCADRVCGPGTCDAGFADCDGDAANGCEVDTRSASAHCGTCDRTCGTAACVDSACGATPEEIYTGAVSEFIVGDGEILISNGYGLDPNQGTIVSIPPGGGAATTLVSAQDKSWYFAKDASGIYWSNLGTGFEGAGPNGAIMALRGGTSTPVELVPNLMDTGPVAIDATRVLYARGWEIAAVPKQGGASQIVVPEAQGARFQALAVDGGWLYFAGTIYASEQGDTAYVGRISLGGGAVEELRRAPAATVTAMTLDETSIYLAEHVPQGDGTYSGRAVRMGKDGADARVIAEPLVAPMTIGVAGGDVYVTNLAWGNPDGATLQRFPADGGGSPVTMAAQLTEPRALHVAGGHVYFATGYGLSRLPL